MANKITVIGAGAWGTAIAAHLTRNGHEVMLWCYEPEVAADISQTKMNSRYLPNCALPEALKVTCDLRESIKDNRWLFIVVPVKALRSVFDQLKGAITGEQQLVVLSKGVEAGTLLLPSQIITQALDWRPSITVLSGPNFAHEVAAGAQSATVVASCDKDSAHAVAKLVSNRHTKVFESDDAIGVQVGGAFKNVMALGLGIFHGAHCCANLQAFLFTQALHEMAQLSVAFGGSADTPYGLSGLGDLVLCATGAGSRNFKIGQLIGQGRSLDSLAEQYPLYPEGVWTLRAMQTLEQKYGIDLPLCRGIYDIVFNEKSVELVLSELFAGNFRC